MKTLVPGLSEHLNNVELDIRIKGNNPRSFDQKVQPDILYIIAKCILKYCKNTSKNKDEFTHDFLKIVNDDKINLETDEVDKIITILNKEKNISKYNLKKQFTIRDIWKSKYANDLIEEIFNKPSPQDKKAQNEYDKFFSQPINFLAFFEILDFEVNKKTRKFFISKINLLEYIASNERNSYMFIVECIKSFNKSNDLELYFNDFFQNQNQQYYSILKDNFVNYLIKNTNIAKITEPRRIFIPIINTLAYHFKKKGTDKGRMSSLNIQFENLKYARVNFRDQITNKERNITRKQWEPVYLENINEDEAISREEARSKKLVKDRHNKISEYSGEKDANQTHHMFPRTYFKKLSSYKENLINLTPNEHFQKAHPYNNTQEINKDFQIELLLCKLNKSIKQSVEVNDGFYDLNKFIEVLNIGFSINLPLNMNFEDVKRVLNFKNKRS